MASSTFAALDVHTSGKEAAGRISKPGDNARWVGGGRVRDGVDRARRSDRDDGIAWSQPDTERTGHVVPSAGSHDGVPVGHPLPSGSLVGPEHRARNGGPVAVGIDQLEHVPSVLPCGWGPVPRA